jgi:hypothetical protein
LTWSKEVKAAVIGSAAAIVAAFIAILPSLLPSTDRPAPMPPGRPQLPALRVDGLYKANHGTFSRLLRFFPDGTALSVTVGEPANAAEVERWLVPGYRYGAEGKIGARGASQYGGLVIEGAAIQFSVRSSDGGIIDYEGTVGIDMLRLNFYSQITKQRGFDEYKFERFGT